MTKFDKALFNTKGEYVSYENKFVARFKHQKSSKGPFITFLIKNFSVEEFFEMAITTPPLLILQSKGYIQPHVKKMLKAQGLPLTQAGVKSLITAK